MKKNLRKALAGRIRPLRIAIHVNQLHHLLGFQALPRKNILAVHIGRRNGKLY
ncbi:hypothetical protein ACFFNY_23520 [Paenibacillus hodogayensis]|uniref:Uncharacterized protein n=1 Tax=Paenibacillus hodogayensis TaxID=279208 RepID=A0ABV5W1V4_9BACL